MRPAAYLRVEVFRLFRAKITWLFVALTAASPLVGLTVYKPNSVETAATQLIINPVLTGIIGASILFALFTLLELDRAERYKTSVLTDAAAPPSALHAAKVLAILVVSLAAWALTVLAYLPYTAAVMQSFFDLELYLSAYLIFLLPAMWMGTLFAAIFYQISRRMDISLVLVAACVLFSFSGSLSGDFILRWINPNLPVFSDGFGNSKPLRMGLYNRAFWLALLGGAWFFSFLFTRRYEKGIFGSAIHNLKRFWLPAAGAFLVLISLNLYRDQPFYNTASAEGWDDLENAGEPPDVRSVVAEITPDFSSGTMHGKITYYLNSTRGSQQKLIINSGYKVYSATVDGEPISFVDLGEDIFVGKHIVLDIPYGTKATRKLEIEYGGYPMLWGAYPESLGQAEISRENVELRNYSLIPTLGLYGMSVTARVVLPDRLTPILVSGTVQGSADNGDGTKTWTFSNHYDYIDMYASAYACKTITSGGTTVEFYFHENFAELLEEHDVEGVLTDVFDYCTAHFGPLHYLSRVAPSRVTSGRGKQFAPQETPSGNSLKLIQTSAFNFGGGATFGQSNMSETSFSLYSLTDPWKGAEGKEILAHEIIHQWWGLNRMTVETKDNPAWTVEGLTVYSTYRLYKEKHGEEYGQVNYVDKWVAAVEKMNRNFYHRHPEYLDLMPEEFAARIRVNELQTAKYCLMPLKIYKAAQLVGGEEAMDEILTRLSQSNNGTSLTYQEFLDACGLTEEALEIG